MQYTNLKIFLALYFLACFFFTAEAIMCRCQSEGDDDRILDPSGEDWVAATQACCVSEHCVSVHRWSNRNQACVGDVIKGKWARCCRKNHGLNFQCRIAWNPLRPPV